MNERARQAQWEADLDRAAESRVSMARWNSINPLVERTAGSLARAHLNRVVAARGPASGVNPNVQGGSEIALVAYVAALYGLTEHDVLDLTVRDLAGEDVEPR